MTTIDSATGALSAAPKTPPIPVDSLTINDILNNHNLSIIHIYNRPDHVKVNFDANSDHPELKHIKDVEDFRKTHSANDLDEMPIYNKYDARYQLVRNKDQRLIYEAKTLGGMLQYLAGRYALQ